jgi:hypothetical protein
MGCLLIPFAPRCGDKALNRVKDARPTTPIGIVTEMAQIGEERIPLHLSRRRILEQARHLPMKRGQRTNQKDGMKRRAVRSLGRGATLAKCELLALHEGARDRRVQQTREKQDPHAHAFACRDLVKTRAGLVDFIIDLSGKGLARCRLTASVRFQSLPIGTVHADFPHTARPVSFIRRVMGRAVLASAFTRTCRRSRGAGVSSPSTTRERRTGIRYSTAANPRSSFVSAFVASKGSEPSSRGSPESR